MIAPEDEKFLRSRKSATRGSTGLCIFSLVVLLGAWGGLFWFFPQYLNPMHVYDGIQDRTLSVDVVNFYAGCAVILYHVSWLLLLILVVCTTRGLRREARLVRIVEGLNLPKPEDTGSTGGWKLG